MTTKTNHTFTEEDRTRFYQVTEEMNIPDEDVAEGLEFFTDLLSRHRFTGSFAACMCAVAVTAYHAGKNAA